MSKPANLGKARKPVTILIQSNWCKGCAFCVEFCPKGVLYMEGAKPAVVKAEECTGCALCVWICPEFAIKVARAKDEADESPSEG